MTSCIRHLVTKAVLGSTVGAVLLLTATPPSRAAEKCKIKILKTGEIQVSAKAVDANPRWGTTPSDLNTSFFNEGTCYDAAKLKLNKCNLGDPATLAGITPPFNCQICIGDDGPNDCCIFSKGCSPGMRMRDASFAVGDPRIEALYSPDTSTLRFDGVNLQIVDGSGDTSGAENGKGNLIIGYNEDDSPSAPRTGSHNVVVGPRHGWTRNSGMVLGRGNRIQAPYASVTGGYSNIAEAFGSSVTGGRQNLATGYYSTVSGGFDNKAYGDYSAISGGFRNYTDDDEIGDGYLASVSGGFQNRANGSYSVITGGRGNATEGASDSSSIAGGGYNSVASPYSSIAGGYSNSIYGTGNNQAISGGRLNSFISTTGSFNTIGGGYSVFVSGATADEFHAGQESGFPTATVY